MYRSVGAIERANKASAEAAKKRVACPKCYSPKSLNILHADVRWDTKRKGWFPVFPRDGHVVECGECDHEFELPAEWPQPK
jgi:RNase P subunit RPR2